MLTRLVLTVAVLICGTAAAGARGLEFSEVMSGNVYLEGEFRPASVSLQVTIPDIDAWSRDQSVPAVMSGTLYIDRIPAQPVTGSLQILVPAEGGDGRLLTYRFGNGGWQVLGVKHVRDRNVIADMTTLRAVLQPTGEPLPSVEDVFRGAQWTSELHFEYWNHSVSLNFVRSFHAIDTPLKEVAQVYALFLRTVFGALTCTVFPKYCP
jgi:hypothetical protein